MMKIRQPGFAVGDALVLRFGWGSRYTSASSATISPEASLIHAYRGVDKVVNIGWTMYGGAHRRAVRLPGITAWVRQLHHRRRGCR